MRQRIKAPFAEPPLTSPLLRSPPGVEAPPESFVWPATEAQPESVGPRVTNNYNNDYRVYHVTQHFPVTGMNKQDLRIEPPYLG